MTYSETAKNKPVDKQENIPNLHEIVVTEAMIEAGVFALLNESLDIGFLRAEALAEEIIEVVFRV